MALSIQGTWRNNDHVNAIRLVDIYFSYEVSKRAIIYILGS